MKFVDLERQQDVIRPELTKRIDAVLKHGRYIMGPEIFELEEALSHLTTATHCISCSSGTDALVLALMSFDLQEQDYVLVPAFTFAATAEAVVLAGGIPFFVDVDPDTYLVSANTLNDGLRVARDLGLNLRGVIAAGLFGHPPEFDSLQPFCDANNLFLIDDAAQSLGSNYKNRNTGSLADITATSFFPAKPLGCYGDGGAIFTDNDELAEVLRSIRVHGQGSSKYDNVRIGMNGRLDTIQAAILLAKLTVFQEELANRREIAEFYLSQLDERLKKPVSSSGSAWSYFTISVDDREAMVNKLDEAKVPVQIYYPQPLTELSAFKKMHKSTDVESKRSSSSVLSLPIHPYLTEAECQRVVGAVNEALRT